MGELLKPVYVGDTELPYQEGEPDGPTIHAKDVAPIGRQATWTMTGMVHTHRFFVPAMIQAAGLVTDPVSLYWAEHELPKQEAPFWLDLGWNAFNGLPIETKENRLVWACPIPHAKGLIAYLSRIRFGTPTALEWDVLHQTIRLVDRQLLSTLTTQPDKPPTVPVDVFGLTGPHGVYYWKPPQNYWTDGMSLHFRKPRPENPNRRRPFSPRSTS